MTKSKKRMNRRDFINSSVLSSITLAIGSTVVYGNKIPEGYTLLGMQDPDPFKLFNISNEMTVLNDRPWNIESKAHLLNDKITPNKFMFISNNGIIPEDIDVASWKLIVDGESAMSAKEYTLEDLKKNFKHYTYQLTLECGGNGRKEFNPPAKGNQWGLGAVHCSNWTGIRLKDLLEDVGVKANAVYVAYYAADLHLSRNPEKEPISRGLPMAKALEDQTLIAFQLNGEDIP